MERVYEGNTVIDVVERIEIDRNKRDIIYWKKLRYIAYTDIIYKHTYTYAYACAHTHSHCHHYDFLQEKHLLFQPSN